MTARALARDLAGQLAAAGIEDAPFEAELLVREATGISRTDFMAGAELTSADQERIAEAVVRRLRREPAAYITGHREFYGIDFETGPGALVPRPETELLVELALADLKSAPRATVVDVGTGSGCIAAAIGNQAPTARVIAVDISRAALAIARRNLSVIAPPAAVVRGSLLEAISRAEIVVANLPYIPSGDVATLPAEVRDWEPPVALDGGPDGLTLVRRLIVDCAERVRPGLLAMELAIGQAAVVAAFAEGHGATEVSIHRDLAGIDRVVAARWA